MSGAPNERESLSPPPRTIYDLFEEDDDDEDDDEEMYEPATEDSTDFDGTEEDENDEYLDAVDVIDSTESGITIQFAADGDEDEDENEDGDEDTETEAEPQTQAQAQAQTQTQPETRANGNTRTITLAELNQLIGQHAAIRRLFQNHHIRFVSEDDEDEEVDHWGARRRRRRKAPADPNRFPKVPSEAGRALMAAGVYGNKESHIDTRRKRRRTINERLMWRRLGVDARPSARKYNRLIAQHMVPSTTRADHIIHYNSRAYSGQFSDDGNFFFSCTQNFKVRMYDTSNPYDWKYYKTVDYPFGQWTITDATLSPDNRFLAYSSIRHMVCLAPTDPADQSDDRPLLDFTSYAPGADAGDPRFGFMGRTHGFGIWSLRFSGDGREIVAGTSDSAVLVYDLETRKTTLKLAKHTDDVNAVCFGDKMSPHILYSGSDDQTLRVWDRRSMADRREAGVFVGHTEGLTYVDSKGDGRYVLSNGKDQMMKLWDLRKMTSPHDFDNMNLSQYTSNFDYRFAPYDDDDYTPNPHDCSVVTFRGHSVLKTLIRCHFSPPTSSNSRYVYSGSEDGKVWVYNMDGTVKTKIDVHAATKNTRSRSNEHVGYEYDIGQGSQNWKTCVRDASWSPTAPVLAATSWNGWGMATGTVSMHSWNDDAEDDEGEPSMGIGYNDILDPKPELNVNRDVRSRVGGRGLRSRVVPPRGFGLSGPDGDDGVGW